MCYYYDHRSKAYLEDSVLLLRYGDSTSFFAPDEGKPHSFKIRLADFVSMMCWEFLFLFLLVLDTKFYWLFFSYCYCLFDRKSVKYKARNFIWVYQKTICFKQSNIAYCLKKWSVSTRLQKHFNAIKHLNKFESANTSMHK